MEPGHAGDAGRLRGGARLTLREEALALQADLGGRAVVCRPEDGWPPALALELPGLEPAYAWPCPYGNFSWVRSNAAPVDARDLLTEATLDPGRFR